MTHDWNPNGRGKNGVTTRIVANHLTRSAVGFRLDTTTPIAKRKDSQSREVCLSNTACGAQSQLVMTFSPCC